MQVEVKVHSLGQDRSKQPVVLLREVVGTRLLPIWIGHAEAGSIAMHMAGQEPGRPLTHDLMADVVKRLTGRVERVAITHVSNNTFYAELTLYQDGEVIRVDARPSDAIALAIRTGAPIFAENALLDQVQIEMADASGTDLFEVADPDASSDGPLTDEAPAGVGDSASTPAPEMPKSGGRGQPGEGPRGLTPGELEAYLRTLDPEDFGRFNP